MSTRTYVKLDMYEVEVLRSFARAGAQLDINSLLSSSFSCNPSPSLLATMKKRSPKSAAKEPKVTKPKKKY